MKISLRIFLPVGTLACLAGLAAPAQAEKLVIGVPAWPSAQVTANIISIVAHDRFGTETELAESGTRTLLAKVGSGEIQVHPEIWFPNLGDAVDHLSGEGGGLRVSPIGVAATQNICTTKATISETGIKSVADLAKPEFSVKFDSNGDGKGEIWIGAPTWSSTEIERIRAHSYGYDKTMALLEMPEEIAMASVDAAVASERPIVFYCYGPHHVFKLHDIVMLEEPPFDPSKWNIVKRADDPQWIEKSIAGTAWEPSHFNIGYAASVDTDMPKVAAFLNRIAFESTDIAAMSYAVEVEGKTPEEAAKLWLEANENRVGEWIK